MSIAMVGAVSFAFAGPKKGTSTVVSQQAKSQINSRLVQGHELFVQNKGQWNGKAEFLGQSPGVDVWLDQAGMRLDYYKNVSKNGQPGRKGQVVDLRFAGSNPVHYSPLGDALRKSVYMAHIGGQKAVASSYGSVMAKSVYSGIDLKAHFESGKVRYDWIVSPNADASKIQLNFDGASGVTANGTKLTVKTQVGDQVHGSLYAYQTINGKKVQVPTSFVSTGKNGVAFKVGRYDHSKTLVIDPVVYGTYYGGNDNWDDVRGVVADTNGGVYLTGMTSSASFPVTAGPYYSSIIGKQDAYLAKLQGDAYNVDYSVYFGGSFNDFGQFVQLDPFGNVWVAGITTSSDFPGNVPGSPTQIGPKIFMIRFQASATSILDPVTNPAMLEVGGAGNETLRGFAVVPNASPSSSSPVTLVLEGQSDQATPEVTTGTFANGKGYILRYNYFNGSFTPVASSCEYIGESMGLYLSGLAVDQQGNVYVGGMVGDGKTNTNTATTPGVFTTTAGVFTGGRLLQKNDLFARKYGPDGSLIYSAVVGGADNETTGGFDIDLLSNTYTAGSSIAVDANNNVYITGSTSSFDYPRTRGVVGEVFDGFQHAVVTKISNDFTQLLYSTSLNTQNGVQPAGIAVDGSGRAFISGLCDSPLDLLNYTLSFPFPLGNPPVPNGAQMGSVPLTPNGSDPVVDPNYKSPTVPEIPTSEGFLLVLNPTATKFDYGTYIGGFLDEHVFGPYVDNFGDVWVPGATCANRFYLLVGTSTGGNPPTQQFEHDGGNGQSSPLDPGLITNLAFKPTDVPDREIKFAQPNQILYIPGFFPIYIQDNGGMWLESRDGFLIKFRIGAPVINSITVTPGTIPGGLGETAQVQVILNQAAPAEGAQITLSLDSTAAASFSSNSAVGTTTVTIPAGATQFTAPVTIFTSAVTANTQVLVKADYQGNFKIASLNIVPWLLNLSVTPNTIVGGNTLVATVTLSAPAPASGVTVALSSNDPNLVLNASNSSITIAAGQTTGSASIGTLGVDNKDYPTLTANLLGQGLPAKIEIDPAQMQTLVINPNEAAGGSTFTGTVTLNGLPGPSFPAVAITLTNTAGTASQYTITPSSLTFSGANQATFTIVSPYETSQVTSTVTASMPTASGTDYQAQTLSAQVIVDVSNLFKFTVTPSTSAAGQSVTGTITLQAPAGPGGTPVQLTSDNPTLVPVPPSVTVSNGTTGTSLQIPIQNVAVLQPTVVNLTASRGTQSITQQLTVEEATITLTTDLSSILGGNKLNGTVTLSAPVSADTAVTINFSPSGILSVPVPVVIPAGSNTATFEIDSAGVTSDQTVTLTATAGSVTSAPTTVVVTAPTLVKIAFYPPFIRGGQIAHGIITLDGPAPAGGLDIQLAAVPGLLLLPTHIVVPAGATSAPILGFAVPRVSRKIAVTVTATCNDTSVYTTILISR